MFMKHDVLCVRVNSHQVCGHYHLGFQDIPGVKWCNYHSNVVSRNQRHPCRLSHGPSKSFQETSVRVFETLAKRAELLVGTQGGEGRRWGKIQSPGMSSSYFYIRTC